MTDGPDREPSKDAAVSGSGDNRPTRPYNTRAIGSSAEDEAADYLISQGFTIVERNFRIRIGEIDCIARDRNGTLVFVEVKSARAMSAGHPFFWVGPAKQRTLAAVARVYLASHPGNKNGCRFDVIAICQGKVEHLRNAFLAK
jgi:putative endonuclease